MRKLLLTIAFAATAILTAKAQITISAGTSYSNYGSDVGKATPGVQLRGAYNISPKRAVGFGVSYSLPVKQTMSYGADNFHQTSSFMAGNIFGIFHLIGRHDSKFSLYFPLGIGYVLGDMKYKAVSGGTTTIETEKISGLTANANVGIQVALGAPMVFAEAGFAYPAGNTSNSRTGMTGDNPIPAHSILQLGVRFPFGSSGGGTRNGPGNRNTGKRSPHNRGDGFM